jgi:hypothetical protein
MPLSIAERIAGWGHTVEVVESDPVRDELARIGAELTARYGEKATSRHDDMSPNGQRD